MSISAKRNQLLVSLLEQTVSQSMRRLEFKRFALFRETCFSMTASLSSGIYRPAIERKYISEPCKQIAAFFQREQMISRQGDLHSHDYRNLHLSVCPAGFLKFCRAD